MASVTAAMAIEQRLRDNLTDIPIFTPDQVNQLPDTPQTFVVLEFPGGSAEQYTIGDPGNNVWLETAAFMIHVMVPVSAGSPDTTMTTGQYARSLAEDIAQIFRGQTFATSVLCEAPQPPQESERADGNYWGVSFGVPYRYQYFG